MLETILQWMGAGDQALNVMGPILTVALAWVFGGAATQFFKFPLSKLIAGSWYDWSVRAFAVGTTTAFAHVLSDALPWPLELGAGVTQLLAYKLSLSAIRKFWPWLEASPMVGSVNPPASAFEAAADRAAHQEQ